MLKAALSALLIALSLVSGTAYADEKCNDTTIMRGEPLDEYGTLVVDKDITVKGRNVRIVVQYGNMAMIQCDFDALADYVSQLAGTDMRNDDHLVSSAAGEFFSKRLGENKNASVRAYIY